MAKRKQPKKTTPAKRRSPKKKPAKKVRDARGRFTKAKRPKKKRAKKQAAKPPQAVPPSQPMTTGEAAERAAILKIKAKAQAEGLASLSRRQAKRLDKYEKALHDRLRAQALRSCTQTELGALLQTSDKVFGDWKAEGMPHTNRGRQVIYDLFQVFPWLKERWLAESRSHGDPQAEAVKLRKETAVARMKELELGEREARLVPRDEAQRDRLAVVQAFASMLERLPTDFRSAFPTPEQKPHAAWLDEWQAAERERLISQGGVA